MSAIEKIINKASWRYHMNGGYYEREILDGDIFDQAAAELEEKNELIHQLQNALHVRDTQLESLRAENEKLKTDFVQMTHNCVGAEMEAESLRAEREQLKQAAVLAMRAVEEVAFETLKAHMQKLDSYLANGLSDKLWDEINAAALERVTK